MAEAGIEKACACKGYHKRELMAQMDPHRLFLCPFIVHRALYETFLGTTDLAQILLRISVSRPRWNITEVKAGYSEKERERERECVAEQKVV